MRLRPSQIRAVLRSSNRNGSSTTTTSSGARFIVAAGGAAEPSITCTTSSTRTVTRVRSNFTVGFMARSLRTGDDWGTPDRMRTRTPSA